MSNSGDLNLPSRFKLFRDHLGLSEKEMAEKLGVALTSWTSYELGTGVAEKDVLQNLANLGCNIDWLLTGKGHMRRDRRQDIIDEIMEIEHKAYMRGRPNSHGPV